MAGNEGEKEGEKKVCEREREELIVQAAGK